MVFPRNASIDQNLIENSKYFCKLFYILVTFAYAFFIDMIRTEQLLKEGINKNQ